MTIFIVRRASRRLKRSAFGLWAEGPVRKVSCILPSQADRNWKPIDAFATRLGRQMRAAHISCTSVGPKHRDLCMGNWNVASPYGKEQELVWEAEQYHLDIVGVSSTKCSGSDTVELNEG